MSQGRSTYERPSGWHDTSKKPSQAQQSGRRQEKQIPKSSFTDETLESDVSFLSENAAIEADGEFDESGGNFDSLVGDDELNAAFEAEHGRMFQVLDEVGEDSDLSSPAPGSASSTKKFVIPKVKKPETPEVHDISGEEGKRAWLKNERDISSRHRDAGKGERDREDGSRDRGKDGRDSKEDRRDRGKLQSENGQHQRSHHSPSAATGQEERQSLFDSFAAEGLISPDRNISLAFSSQIKQEFAEKDAAGGEAGKVKVEKKETHVLMDAEEDGHLEIPMGRDSLVFVRGDCLFFVEVKHLRSLFKHF